METHSSKHEDHGPDVKIVINANSFTVHRGRRTVEELKKLGGVPLADDLVLVINGKLEVLPDDGGVTIKGGETFISHPKGAGSA